MDEDPLAGGDHAGPRGKDGEPDRLGQARDGRRSVVPRVYASVADRQRHDRREVGRPGQLATFEARIRVDPSRSRATPHAAERGEEQPERVRETGGGMAGHPHHHLSAYLDGERGLPWTDRDTMEQHVPQAGKDAREMVPLSDGTPPGREDE